MDLYRGIRREGPPDPVRAPNASPGLAGGTDADGRPLGVTEPSLAAHRAVTAALFTAALGLQLAAPLLRDRVPLSDALFIDSVLIPVWTAVLLGLLAMVLWLATRRGDSWPPAGRIAWGVGVGVVIGVLHAFGASALVGGMPVDTMGPVEVALLWGIPAILWLVPAAALLIGWARSRWRIARSLAVALVALGVLNFPFILWLTHLWAVYVNVAPGTAV